MKMRKLMMIAAVAVAVVSAKAASVDWNYTGTSSQEGYTVYAFTTAVAAQYDTFADLIADAGAGTGTVTAISGRTGTTYMTADTTLTGVTDTIYLVVVSGSDATTYQYGSVSASGYTYDPDSQDTSPGKFKIQAASIASTGTIGGGGDVPEPTSGLLLLVGGAMLALRRKQK